MLYIICMACVFFSRMTKINREGSYHLSIGPRISLNDGIVFVTVIDQKLKLLCFPFASKWSGSHF